MHIHSFTAERERAGILYKRNITKTRLLLTTAQRKTSSEMHWNYVTVTFRLLETKCHLFLTVSVTTNMTKNVIIYTSTCATCLNCLKLNDFTDNSLSVSAAMSIATETGVFVKKLLSEFCPTQRHLLSSFLALHSRNLQTLRLFCRWCHTFNKSTHVWHSCNLSNSVSIYLCMYVCLLMPQRTKKAYTIGCQSDHD